MTALSIISSILATFSPLSSNQMKTAASLCNGPAGVSAFVLM
jgi:hypothetical protein